MKSLALYILLFLVAACNRGSWVTPDVYRPKHPKFSILKQPYQSNELLDNSSLYISTKKFLNYDGNVLIGYMGFYNDGRMIVDNAWEKEMQQTLQKKNSYATAISIGYYTTNGNTINAECFFPGDGGQYVSRQGLIRKDTIILSQTFKLLFKNETRYDTLVKSTYALK